MTNISNNTERLQTILETLKTKATGGSNEDVAEETNAYTEKIAQLATAVTALENELAGKASSGSGSANIETCTVIITSTGGEFGEDTGTLLYTTVENGEITVKRVDGKMNNISISCLCGSLLIVNESTYRFDHNFSGLETIIDTADFMPFYNDCCYPFKVTAAAGDTATLDIELD